MNMGDSTLNAKSTEALLCVNMVDNARISMTVVAVLAVYIEDDALIVKNVSTV